MSARGPHGPRDAVVVAAVRTPVGKGRPARPGKPGGALHGWHPVDLAAEAMRGALRRAGRDPDGVKPRDLDDVLVGCVGQGREQAYNVGRNAALAAGLLAAGCTASDPLESFAEWPEAELVRVCYNSNATTPDDVRALAEEECADYGGRITGLVGQSYWRCPVLTPAGAVYRCEGVSEKTNRRPRTGPAADWQ